MFATVLPTLAGVMLLVVSSIGFGTEPIGGVAAKQLGLLAAAGVFLLKFWMLLLIGVVAIGALVAKLAGRKKAV